MLLSTKTDSKEKVRIAKVSRGGLARGVFIDALFRFDQLQSVVDGELNCDGKTSSLKQPHENLAIWQGLLPAVASCHGFLYLAEINACLSISFNRYHQIPILLVGADPLACL